MIVDIVPDNATEDAYSIALNGLTMSRPRLETAGMWLMCDWEHDGDGDIFGICLTDGDCEGFCAPRDEDAANALADIMCAVYNDFGSRLELEVTDKTQPEMLWEAWQHVQAVVDAYKAEPDGPSLGSRLMGGYL